MKSFQVRLADEVYERVKEIAAEREMTLADVLRDALEVYCVGVVFAQEGKRLVWEDPQRRERAEVLIPGFTRVPAPANGKESRRAPR